VPGKQIPYDLREAALEALRPLGIASLVLEEVRAGGTSFCYVARGMPTGQRLVIKRAAAGGDLSAQFEALQKAAPCSCRRRAIVPEVYALLEGGRSLAMEHVEGRSAWDLCGARRFEPLGAAGAIWRAMEEYHRRTGAPFGDFHPRNAIVSDRGEVRLIDPGEVRPGGGRPELEDMAHWTYSTSASTLDALSRKPWTLARAARLNVALIRLAAEGFPLEERMPFPGSVAAEAGRRLTDLRRSRWRRDRAAERVGRLTLWWIMRAAARASAQPQRWRGGYRSDVVGEAERHRRDCERHGGGASGGED
jgi:hypothetical protein